ncbi:MAG TPA: Asp23/Gls24 family envelope stress response protein [Solirubrobacteraceae bacterium]|nr:Asp23/Gls24 family envelope stress response protein [Solirubrobacteraceae bacterium]
MSTGTQRDSDTQAGEQPGGGSQGGSQAITRRGAEGSELESERGTTTIADGVVAKVVGIAAREVPGIYAMGGAPARALGRVTAQVGIGDERSQGVSVEVGQREAATDLAVVVEYGESIARVANEVRENVIRRVEGLCGLDATEVNIAVVDLHFPGDEQDEQQERQEAPERARVE